MGPRNLGPRPYLDGEGELLEPLRIPEELKNSEDWSVDLSPYDRVHYHQTLASVRRYTHFKPLLNIVPRDALEFALLSQYDHGLYQFGEKVDAIIQGTTMGVDDRRRLRNTRDIPKTTDVINRAVAESFEEVQAHKIGFEGSAFGPVTEKFRPKKEQKYEKYNQAHILHVGGIKERRHPSNVKLMNSSHHSSQTNAGYSRQDSDGNAYQY